MKGLGRRTLVTPGHNERITSLGKKNVFVLCAISLPEKAVALNEKAGAVGTALGGPHLQLS